MGVNTGWASIGNVGSKANSDHTALGQAVNRAFRLEAATRELACDLALGHETYHCRSGCTDASRIFKASTVMFKGYAELTTAHTAELSSLSSLF